MYKNRNLLFFTMFIFIVFFICEAFVLYKRAEPLLTLAVANNDVYSVYAFNLETNKAHDLGEYWSRERRIEIPISHFEETNSNLDNYILKVESDDQVGFILYTYLDEHQENENQRIHDLYKEHYCAERTVAFLDKTKKTSFSLNKISDRDYDVVINKSEKGSELKQGAYIIPGFNDTGHSIGELFILNNISTGEVNSDLYQRVSFKMMSFTNGSSEYDFMIPYNQEIELMDKSNLNPSTIQDKTLLFHDRELTIDVLFYDIK